MAQQLNLRVEYFKTPHAVATRRPRFTWEVPLAGRSRRQTAYRVLVASSTDRLSPSRADLWDSGKVVSSQSANIEYAGQPLQGNRDLWWNVELWDEAGQSTGPSQAEPFGTAVFEQSDWTAKWIGMGDPGEPIPDPAMYQHERVTPDVQAFEPDQRAPMLRKSFRLDKPVRRARAMVCAVGLGELRLNGEKVGIDVLSTPRTAFRKTVRYNTYDVSASLREGENVLGLILGNGWYNGQKKYWGWRYQWHGSPRGIVQLEIEYQDGSTARIISDNTWRGSWSPITFNCIFDGEEYDARLEQAGWDAPGFNDSAWKPVSLQPSPGGKITPVPHEQNRITETFCPVSMSSPAPGVYVYNMGKNMTGWVRLCVKNGRAGETIKLRYGEGAFDDGRIDCATNNAARQADLYTMRGDVCETYEPRFTYHGFQYVELTGYPGQPDLNTLEACFVRSEIEQIGTFECGHDLLNKVHRCTVQSQMCNFQMGVPTDDTQRTERLGWAGDAWSYAEEAYYNFGAEALFAKWIADFYDEQDETGMVGMIVPQSGSEEDLVWSSAFLLIPWWQYVHRGDKRLLEDSYSYLQFYMQYLEKVGQSKIEVLPAETAYKAVRHWSPVEKRYTSGADRGHLQISQWGDHLATNEGSMSARRNQPLSIATAFYFYNAVLMTRIANVLGKRDDAKRYQELSEQIKQAFNDRFFSASAGYYDIGCQSAQAWPLAFGLVPQEHRERVSNYLNSSVNQRQQCFTTGYAGTKWAVQAVANSGHHDFVWERAIATDYPSWGYMLRDPKRTTITENWMGKGSLCHTTLGAAIDEWFYWGLAGIQPDESAPGYEKVLIKPYLPKALSWARASIRTARGLIVSRWKHDGKQAELCVTIPANSTGEVHLPANPAEAITESGVALAQAMGVEVVSAETAPIKIVLGSGSYQFNFTLTS